MVELYKKYRPKNLARVVGNQGTVDALKNMLQRESLPHTILFHGPSGCGKTTLARILRRELGCSDMDFKELNCSDFRGIDTIRDISRRMNLAPTGGSCRIWLMDEVHQLSRDGQNAALKILEDTPAHVYFFLCTTDPQKLLKTIRTRCCEMPVVLLGRKEMKLLLSRVLKREKQVLSEEMIEDIVDAAQGSARSALVLLDKVLNVPCDKRGDVVLSADESEEVIALCRNLIKKSPWNRVAKILRGLQEDPESIRWAVLGYARAVLLQSANQQAYHVLSCFEENFYDSKAAGLARACYEAVMD